ncbi:hypothetical protein [Acinetobacter sp. YH01020]|uniref:hypothetical protein n=1 Tax=Acinetobacter sp. YH01020 TaxID=2601034 RepID=UPI0015D1CABC|nr:hypothetical protein [Acinetobacter sp. YH01020]
MKYALLGLISVVVIAFYAMNQSNKADAERLKQAEMAHQQKLEQDKANEERLANEAKQREINAKAIRVEKDQAQNKAIAAEFEKKHQVEPIIIAENKPEPIPEWQIQKAEREKKELCSASMRLAKTIMGKRQNGANIEEMMEANQSPNKATQRIAQDMIISAYEHPAYSSESVKNKVISSFANDAYLACIKAS